MFVNNNYFYRLLIIILAVLSYSQNKLVSEDLYILTVAGVAKKYGSQMPINRAFHIFKAIPLHVGTH